MFTIEEESLDDRDDRSVQSFVAPDDGASDGDRSLWPPGKEDFADLARRSTQPMKNVAMDLDSDVSPERTTAHRNVT